ncbi:uncharacterized protein [Apteryx mantelli]|uniref:Uncharacterized protein n=1 Tax=Apteryx mantelli TaxID=2696672 RepID=A0ABM4DYP8_9AVES
MAQNRTLALQTLFSRGPLLPSKPALRRRRACTCFPPSLGFIGKFPRLTAPSSLQSRQPRAGPQRRYLDDTGTQSKRRYFFNSLPRRAQDSVQLLETGFDAGVRGTRRSLRGAWAGFDGATNIWKVVVAFANRIDPKVTSKRSRSSRCSGGSRPRLQPDRGSERSRRRQRGFFPPDPGHGFLRNRRFPRAGKEETYVTPRLVAAKTPSALVCGGPRPRRQARSCPRLPASWWTSARLKKKKKKTLLIPPKPSPPKDTDGRSDFPAPLHYNRNYNDITTKRAVPDLARSPIKKKSGQIRPRVAHGSPCGRKNPAPRSFGPAAFQRPICRPQPLVLHRRRTPACAASACLRDRSANPTQDRSSLFSQLT